MNIIYNFQYPKLKVLENFGIKRISNNTFKNEKLRVEFNYQNSEDFNIYNGIHYVKIIYSESKPILESFVLEQSRYSRYYFEELKNPKLKYEVSFRLDIHSLNYTKGNKFDLEKERQELFVKLLLDIFLNKQYIWSDNYRFCKIINDIKKNNKYRFGTKNKFDLKRLRIIKQVDFKYKELNFNKKYGYEYELTTTTNYHLLYDEILIENKELELFLPVKKINKNINSTYRSDELENKTKFSEDIDVLKMIKEELNKVNYKGREDE